MLYEFSKDNEIIVNGQIIGKVDLGGDDFNKLRMQDFVSSMNYAMRETSKSVQVQVPTVDEPCNVADFLVKHHVPFIGPDMGTELLKIIKRLEVVSTVYPLPEDVDVYRLSIILLVQVATQHQKAFCDMVEGVLSE